MSGINGNEQPVWVFPQVVPPAVCDLLLEEAQSLALAPGQTGPGTLSGLRSSSIGFLPTAHWFRGVVERYAWEASATAGWGFDLAAMEAMQVARYVDGGGYGWHVDSFQDQGFVRKLSVSIQLSDPSTYDGGELQWCWFGSSEGQRIPKPEGLSLRGSVVVFPSYHLHRVTPVTRGERWSLVGWVRGPRFR